MLVNSIYIPRTDTYDVTFRYKNISTDNAPVDIEVYDSNMNLISEKKDVHFLGSGQDTGWKKLVLKLEFTDDPQSIIKLKSRGANMALVIDYFSVSMGEYHDNLFPSKITEYVPITTGISKPIDSFDDIIEVYPTVFRDHTFINYNLSFGQQVQYRVTDILGRNLNSGLLYASCGKIPVGNDLSRGLYILQFWTGGKRKSVKLVKTF